MTEAAKPTSLLSAAGGLIEMPAYRSHKIVHALQISAITGNLLTFTDARFAPLQVSDEYIAKRDPTAGGYFVVYEDGYQSFSPREAFDKGYCAVDNDD